MIKMSNILHSWRFLYICAAWQIICALTGLPCQAQSTSGFDSIDTQWNGHLRLIGMASFPGENAIYTLTGDTRTFYDSQAELRLKNNVYLGETWALETHYELVARHGDTLAKNSDLQGILSSATVTQLTGTDTVNDDRQLMNLTSTIDEDRDYLVYHRLDRLNLTHTSTWGTVRIGRQALTWGNGLIFNPMDLFNPFAPTAIQRDYKTGADMAVVQMHMGSNALEALYVPRRNPATGKIESDQASWAAKWHALPRNLELELMAAQHFNDHVIGLGTSGYWQDAAWRINTVWTNLHDSEQHNSALQIVANLDYAWQWAGKNVYGFIEGYYNSLGYSADYADAISDPAIQQRMNRGELFTLGRTYLASQLKIELHPLVQAQCTSIINLSDPSGTLQPQIHWDAANDLQFMAGADWYWGSHESEFGGFNLPVEGTLVSVAPMNRIYLWLTYFF